MKSSETSAKYSCPSREQNEDIQDSGTADSEEDIVLVEAEVERSDIVASDAPMRRFCISSSESKFGFGASAGSC